MVRRNEIPCQTGEISEPALLGECIGWLNDWASGELTTTYRSGVRAGVATMAK